MSAYRVGMGETPDSIAARYGRSGGELMRANRHKERIRDGKLVFLGLVPGETVNLPRHWGVGATITRRGLGAPFALLAGVVYVDAQIALAACQSGWEKVSTTCAECPPTLVSQVQKTAAAGGSDVHYVYYDGGLYELNFPGGGRGWVQRRCMQPNKALIPGVFVPPTTPPTTQPPLPIGPIKPIDYKLPSTTTETSSSKSSAWPIVIAIGALAGGVGLAYLVTKRKEGELSLIKAKR